METLLIYFLQTSIGIILFYLLYSLLLKNETYYKTNRLFLIAGLILSLAIPLFPISYESPIAIINNSDFFSIAEKPALVNMESTMNLQGNDRPEFNFLQLLPWIYVMGMIIFMLRLVWQTIRISWKIRHSKFEIIEDIKIIDQKTTMPFSFFNVVFIDIQEYSERELSNIIAHEKVHIRERHWVDLLIIELMTVLFWVNPVVWLYEKSIKQNHEYLADQGVLLAGYSPGQYQALLINQLMGVKVLGFAHNLNFSLNKKRMEMMKKEKSPGVSKIKLLLALPVIALLVFAFAKKEYVMSPQNAPKNNEQISKGSRKTVKEPIYISGEVLTMDGMPVIGAKFLNDDFTFDVVSNEKGEFEIEIPKGYKYNETTLDDGTHSPWIGIAVTVACKGFDPAKALIDPVKKRTSVKIQMRSNINVRGRIINNYDQPLDRVKITDMKNNVSVTSNSKGEFEIASTQYHILRVEKPGYKTVHYTLVDLANNSIEVVMKKGTNPTIKVKGKVVNSDGLPMTGANVILKDTNTGTVVDERGEFELDAPEEFSLVISFIGYKTVMNKYSFMDKTNATVKIKMEEGIFNIDLPDIGDNEHLVNGEIMEVAPPPPPPKKGRKGEVFTIVEDMPVYQNGGMYQLALDLKDQTNRVMEKTKDRGEAVVGFTVTPEGKVQNPHIVTSANSKMLDESALKIVSKLDNWNPGIQRGKPVKVDLTVPVKFE